MPNISLPYLLDRCFFSLHILYLLFLALGIWVSIDEYFYTAVDGSSPFCGCNPLPSVYDDLMHYGYTQLIHALELVFCGFFALVWGLSDSAFAVFFVGILATGPEYRHRI